MIWNEFRKEDAVLNWCERKYFGQEKLQKMNRLIRKSQENDSKLKLNVTYYPALEI